MTYQNRSNQYTRIKEFLNMALITCVFMELIFTAAGIRFCVTSPAAVYPDCKKMQDRLRSAVLLFWGSMNNKYEKKEKFLLV